MTDDTPAGDQAPHTNIPPDGATPRIRVSSVAGFLAVVPHLLGFHPSQSMVVVGLDARRGRIMLAFRYDLPDPPDPVRSQEIAQHAVAVFKKRRIKTAIAAGYGPGTRVTPVAESLRAGLRAAGLTVRDLLRVEDGRYWSYLCQDPRCCPPEGVPFDGSAHPAAAALAAAGMAARPDRASLVGTLASLTGPAADAMAQATERALRRTEELAGPSGEPGGMRLVVEAGREAVRAAIGIYRRGGQITDLDQLAWLTVTVADLRVRDDAWARMEPRHRAAHRRLWIDVVRHACEPYVPAPASLLAFTAWQAGEGALANVAIERALAADPEYSMAHLLGQALDAGLPPSAARLPMTPEEVEASYAGTEFGGIRRPPAAAASPRRSSGRSSAGRSSAERGSAQSPGRKSSSPGRKSSPGRPASPGQRSPGQPPSARRSPGRPSATRPASRRPSA
jgi:hypothetical protein